MATFYNEARKNSMKTWFLLSFFSLLLIATGWGLSFAFGDITILYIAVIFAVISSFISYWKSDKIVLAMSNAKEAPEKDYPDIHNIVENLAISEGLPKPKIYIINEDQPNAFATGRNPEHGVIAVTKGLLDRLDKSETEAVIAHELAHIKNRDVLVSTIAVVFAGAISIASRIFLRSLIFGRGRRSNNSNGNGNALMLIIGIIVAILAPIFAVMIRLAISRKREYLADSSAILNTRYPDGLASALEKISSHPKELKAANDATANL
ncbi:MAG: M48 family metallopeptidase, partial [Candidatus Woesearchaeota archaeon]